MSLRTIDTGLRYVKLLELIEIDGWRIKLYGMSLGAEPPSEEFVAPCRDLIRRTLPYPARTINRLGVGFATLHAGEHGDYLLINWWEPHEILKQHLFGAAHPHDGKLEYGWPRSVVGCIWEMAVPWFERNSWYRHVLSRLDHPDLDAYLADHLEGTI